MSKSAFQALVAQVTSTIAGHAVDSSLRDLLQAKFPPKNAYAKAKVLPLDQLAAQADNTKKRWEKEIEGGR